MGKECRNRHTVLSQTHFPVEIRHWIFLAVNQSLDATAQTFSSTKHTWNTAERTRQVRRRVEMFLHTSHIVFQWKHHRKRPPRIKMSSADGDRGMASLCTVYVDHALFDVISVTFSTRMTSVDTYRAQVSCQKGRAESFPTWGLRNSSGCEK